MSSASANPYFIPPEPGRFSASAMAVLMHLALLAFFWIGIDWRSETPLAVEAEVWDVKVREAAPKPVAEEIKETPKPPPVVKPVVAKPEETPAPKVDIALEQEKKRKKLLEKRLVEEQLAKEKLEQKKQDEAQLEKENKEKLAKLEDKKKLALEKKRKDEQEAAAREKLRADEMRRIAGNIGSGGTGDASRSTGPRGDPSYAAALITKIKSNINYVGTQNEPGNPQAIYKITQLPSGEVIGVKKVKSSGIPAYDLAVENAITKSSPLPRKKDGTVDREVDAKFNLKD